MTGTLYLCATPIGNLEDMTFRAVRILGEVDLIAAEDTRNSLKLLNHFQVKTPMTSYHEHNKIEKAHVLAEKLKDGQSIALITDAGTPGISDPGEELVRVCYEEGIPVTSLPGASAVLTALTLSGLGTRRFAFEAFLPVDKRKRKIVLDELREESRTIVMYEAPHHLRALLKELQEVFPADRQITLCRELTKKHEEVIRTTIGAASELYEEQEPRGEYVLVIEGKSFRQIQEEAIAAWEGLSIPEHVGMYEAQGIDHKEAMKMAARDRGISKREIYQALLN